MVQVFFWTLAVSSILLGFTYYYVLQNHRRKPKTWGVPEAIYNYIKQQMKRGFTEAQIKKELVKMEWEKDLPRVSLVELEERKGSVEDQGALVLRFALGLIFIAQGLFFKLLYPSRAELTLYGQVQASLGWAVEPSTLIALAGLLQLLLGLLLLAGLWTRVVAALSALFLTQVTLWWSFTGSPQLDLILLLSISLALLMLGGGSLSADKYLGIP